MASNSSRPLTLFYPDLITHLIHHSCSLNLRDHLKYSLHLYELYLNSLNIGGTWGVNVLGYSLPISFSRRNPSIDPCFRWYSKSTLIHWISSLTGSPGTWCGLQHFSIMYLSYSKFLDYFTIESQRDYHLALWISCRFLSCSFPERLDPGNLGTKYAELGRLFDPLVFFAQFHCSLTSIWFAHTLLYSQFACQIQIISSIQCSWYLGSFARSWCSLIVLLSLKVTTCFENEYWKLHFATSSFHRCSHGRSIFKVL